VPQAVLASTPTVAEPGAPVIQVERQQEERQEQPCRFNRQGGYRNCLLGGLLSGLGVIAGAILSIWVECRCLGMQVPWSKRGRASAVPPGVPPSALCVCVGGGGILLPRVWLG
jgi:hypothetical protein